MSPVASRPGRPAMGTGNGARSSFVAHAIPTHVPEPATELSFVPFYVKDDGDGTFSVLSKTAPYAAFDLQAHAGITVSKTYYVATTGNDTTGDGSSGKPFASLAKALGMTDVDKVIMADGWYKVLPLAEPTRNVKIIGVGDVYITSQWLGTPSWSLDTTHYESPCNGYIYAVMDKSSTDANGDWSLLTQKASEAEVEATANSWWIDNPNDVIYVHTYDGRLPDANIVLLASGSKIFNWSIDNKTFYIENIKLITPNGGITFGCASSAGTGSKIFLKNCEVDGVDVSSYGYQALGCPEMVLQNCTSKRTDDDGVRSNPANTLNSNVVEIDCTLRNCGKAGDTTINGSSSHSDGIMVRINGSYHHTYGRPVHDFNNGHAWCLGVHANDCLVATMPNFEMSGTSGVMWCDQCVSANSDFDYAGAIHKHNCTGDATDGAGTDTYDY